MNENQLFQALNEVDEQYMAELDIPAKCPRMRKTIIIAACIALLTLLCGSAWAIAEGGLSFLGTSRETWEDGTIEIGYQIEAVLDEMPMSQIKGNAQSVSKIIRKQFREHTLLDSWSPNCWRGRYETSAEMLEYLGCEHISFPDFGWQEEQSTLYIDAKDQMGNFQRVDAEVYYTHADYRINTHAIMYMELDSGRVTLGSLDKYRDSYTQETYVTEDGRTAVIVCAWDGINLSYLDGFVVVGNVLYYIHLIGGGHTQAAQTQAIDLVKQWLDAF